MSELARPTTEGTDGAEPIAGPPPSRARRFTETLAGLTTLDGVHGGLIVAADGFVITSAVSAGYGVEALSAVGAALGRELERGAERLGRGELGTAVFATADGMILIGTSLVGFLIVIGDRSADVGAVREALRQALARLRDRSLQADGSAAHEAKH